MSLPSIDDPPSLITAKGRFAFYGRSGIDDNPYNNGSTEWLSWRMGWMMGYATKELPLKIYKTKIVVKDLNSSVEHIKEEEFTAPTPAEVFDLLYNLYGKRGSQILDVHIALSAEYDPSKNEQLSVAERIRRNEDEFIEDELQSSLAKICLDDRWQERGMCREAFTDGVDCGREVEKHHIPNPPPF